jgi:leader peptidase (prepilin peptidase)/N-methyltransferase
LTGVAVVLLYVRYSQGHVAGGWDLVFYAVALFGFLALLFFDYKYFILPDKIIFSLLAVAIVWKITLHGDLLWPSIITALAMAGVFDILYVVSGGRWMGFGDVKLALLIGFVFAYPASLLISVLSIWLAALVGVTMLASGRASLKTALPFGSFLALLSIVWITFGNEFTFLTIFFR